jgi:two-component system, NarL family, response regulator NreC
MALKIIVADDHTLLREALCNKLNNNPDLEVTAQADNGRNAVELAKKHVPDVIIMDVSMPDMNGIEASRRISENSPNIKIIALSMHSEQKFVINMLKAGASGYLNKACRFEELIEAINVVTSGEIYLDRSIGTKIIKDYLNAIPQEVDDNSEKLTGREREVLQMVTEGKSSKEIAFKLGIEEHTVVKHRQNIMNKLNIRDIPGLTKYAIHEGIISL